MLLKKLIAIAWDEEAKPLPKRPITQESTI